MHFKNVEACQFHELLNDKMSWVLDNVDTVVGMKNVTTNVIGNYSSMIPAALDLFTMAKDAFNGEDACQTDS